MKLHKRSSKHLLCSSEPMATVMCSAGVDPSTLSQRVNVGVWYLLEPRIAITWEFCLGPKYVLYAYPAGPFQTGQQRRTTEKNCMEAFPIGPMQVHSTYLAPKGVLTYSCAL